VLGLRAQAVLARRHRLLAPHRQRCNGGRAQAWLAYPRPGGVLQIRLARAAGRCLTAPAGPGPRVRLWRCGAAGQQWQIGRHGHLVSLRSSLCLADPGAGPSLRRCADTTWEHWNLR
jgi:hypothetical protein